MSLTVVARRYATALFKTALEKNAMADISKDVNGLSALCKSSVEFLNTVRNPVLPGPVKRKLFETILKGQITDATRDFISFMIEKNRLALLPETLEAFIVMEKEHNGVAEARIVSARPMDATTVASLETGLKTRYKKSYTIKTEEDQSLVGGFTLYLGDKVFDYSIKNQIKLLKEQLLSADSRA